MSKAKLSDRTSGKKSNKTRRARAPAPPVPAVAPPLDQEKFKQRLLRDMLTLRGLPRRCREPLCRRRKTCAGRTLRCERDEPAPKLSQEQEAATMAALRRAVERRLAEFAKARAEKESREDQERQEKKA